MDHARPPSYATVDIHPAPLGSHEAEPAPAPKQAKLPTVDDNLTHLKLLECFNKLRRAISFSTNLFGIRDDFVPANVEGATRNETLARIREKRWAIYVAKAVLRFQAWWTTVEARSKMLTESDMEKETYATITSNSKPMYLGVDNLPPIDVLLVLHAFLLSPRSFLADCIRYGKLALWAAGMPWEPLSQVISQSTFEYEPSREARETFQRQSGRQWNLLQENPIITFRCWRCPKSVQAPMTTADDPILWSTEKPGAGGQGFADSDFKVSCDCGLEINRHNLGLQALKSDMRALFKDQLPMPGTLLTTSGCPDVASKETPGKGAYQMTFPNRLIKAGLGRPLARSCSKRGATFQDILSVVSTGLDDEKLLTKAMGSKGPHALQLEKIALRRMLLKYRETTSRFTSDLVGAVIRQSTFTTKMHNMAWAEHPEGSNFESAMSRYRNFFTLLERHTDRHVVPTLDIDLVWHTHMTMPASYYAFSVEQTGTLVDHDKLIGEDELGDAFEWTCKTYQNLFGKAYAECICWYCEALRESILEEEEAEAVASLSKSTAKSKAKRRALFSSKAGNKDPVSQSVYNLHSSPPKEGNHISTHGAYRNLYQDPQLYIAAMTRSNKMERNFKNVVERAIANKRRPPERDNGEAEYSWGCELAGREGWAPNMADPNIAPGLYGKNPLEVLPEIDIGSSTKRRGITPGSDIRAEDLVIDSDSDDDGLSDDGRGPGSWLLMGGGGA